ncbi:hypothetical protein DFA_05714 [Cavenderia fasciculata]|uniref:Transmembrane protein n=1 Tax=Cavenderia fasciculata TaxID=261658 RepID=F4PM81_CACFS|nr:uncharacterized protein DFA_05714 [Cavenderia fasciculata]EGG23581.1 hypothetical protein DFA_05714 [Cavenderia fasciculata]|eukprot:XP_004361432.1 hypothetical protein DFA_05714 [Cavenderia fasciculata]
MHKPNLLVLILIGIAWVMLIISFSSYWYYAGSKSSSDNYSFSYFKHDGVRTEWKFGDNSGSSFSSYSSAQKDAAKNELSLYRASLSFTVIAWIVLSATILFVVLSLFGILSKIPLLPTITKLLPIAGFVLCCLALFIFVGLPDARKRDCKRNGSDSFCDSQADDHKFDFVYHNDNYRQSPWLSWATIVVASAFCLGGAIVGVISGSY